MTIVIEQVKRQGLETKQDTSDCKLLQDLPLFFTGERGDALGWETNSEMCLPAFYIHSLFKINQNDIG